MEQPHVPPRPRLPRTIVALVSIWALVEMIMFLVDRPDDALVGAAFAIAEVLSFIYSFLILGLIAHGLIGGSRIVWVAAFLWQALRAGFGIINLTVNDYGTDAFSPTSDIGFFDGVFPISIAVVSVVLLLLPPTQKWIRGD